MSEPLPISRKLGKGNLLYGGEAYHDDGPWTHPDNYYKFNGLPTHSQGGDDHGFSVTARVYHGNWHSGDQIPGLNGHRCASLELTLLQPRSLSRKGITFMSWRVDRTTNSPNARRRLLLVKAVVVVLTLSSAPVLHATVFGTIRGVVHDPQHRPVQGATVTLKARSSEWTTNVTSNADGEFRFTAVPIGEYSISIEGSGFAPAQQNIVVISGTEPVAHFQLQIATRSESFTVSAPVATAPADTATPATLVCREDVKFVPGADRTNRLDMITGFVPGAYITHDQLHIRGGHPGQPRLCVHASTGFHSPLHVLV